MTHAARDCKVRIHSNGHKTPPNLSYWKLYDPDA